MMIDDKSNDEPPKEEVERTGSYFETQFITTNNKGEEKVKWEVRQFQDYSAVAVIGMCWFYWKNYWNKRKAKAKSKMQIPAKYA